MQTSERPNLSEACFNEANVARTDLSKAHLGGAAFQKANIARANLSGADLRGAQLNEARLNNVDLTGANLSHADFTDASVRWADMSNCELFDTPSLEVDSTRIVHARFSPRAMDKWSVLRRTYTGPKLAINLLFVALFFIPLIVKGAALWGLSILQEPATNVSSGDQPSTQSSISIEVVCSTSGDGAVKVTLHPQEIRVGEVRATSPLREWSIKCQSMPAWQMLLGFGGPYGHFMPTLTVLLVLYQIARFLMTNQISLMRDAEERSGVSPAKVGWLAYTNLYLVHRILSVVFWIAVAAFALRAIEFLSSDVIIQLGDG